MDDISDIRKLYDDDPLHEDVRLDEHQLKFDITWRWLLQVLPDGGHILELGAATGRYTIPLAGRGYRVTAFDLSAQATELSRIKAQQAGQESHIEYLVGDARDLACLGNTPYDAALVMGPLYHLIHEADRRLVLEQVYQVLKPGAPIISAFINRLGILGDLMAEHGNWINKEDEVEWVLRDGRDPPDYHRGGFRGYFCRPEELAPLHESVGFVTLAVAASEPCIGADDASYNSLVEPQRSRWLDMLFRVCTEPSLLGASRHLLYIGHKPG
ncbi:MAG: class I SAM-dependent methyltransferase [Anaerolineae bacterium]